MKRVATRALAATLLICCGASLSADGGKEGQSAAKVVTLETRDLTDLAGKEALVVTVEYPPGGASTPHRHDAHVFVYVLEGSIVMQVDGREPVTLRAGETFYENPQDVHRTSKNASASEPAKFLVFFVKDKGKPVTRPL
jgi:quercetin dioxygenase-like cupin family protein